MSGKNPSLEPSPRALFRYQAICQVLWLESRGEERADAVRQVASQPLVTADGQLRRVSPRSLYRWLAAYREGGFEALSPAESSGADSRVVSAELLEFFREQKQADPAVSIPEMIRQARELGKVDPEQALDRSTVWRRLRAAGISTRRRQAPADSPARRFAYPHRMDLTLCDGKYFRAGATRRKRVALFFLDDATRFVLHVVVGPSESAELFLRGLFETVLRHGLMRALYFDRGTGFIARDSVAALRNLGVLFIYGRRRYPEGHGKIERFNRTVKDQLLRHLDGDPGVDPDSANLDLRLGHYLEKRYHRTPHESLQGKTPLERFQSDPVPLRFASSQSDLEQAFVVHFSRRVSRDHVVSIDGVCYEAPAGTARARVSLRRHLLDGSIRMLHEGRLVRLSRLDPAANARRPCSRRPTSSVSEASSVSPPRAPAGSAQLAFQRDLGPIVDAEGGFREPDPKDSSKEKPEPRSPQKGKDDNP